MPDLRSTEAKLKSASSGKGPLSKRAARRSSVEKMIQPYARSRVSNGSTILVGTDNRSPHMRRFRDLIALHIQDRGGPDNASEAVKSMIRRAAALTVELEKIEAIFATGALDAAHLDLYSRAANTLRRLLESVGIDRAQKDVTPNIFEYIHSSAQDGEDPASSGFGGLHHPDQPQARVWAPDGGDDGGDE